MNVNYVKIVIGQATASIKANGKDLSYKEALQKKVENLEQHLCSDQDVKTMSDLQDDKDHQEVSTYVADLTNDLQQSI